MMYGGVWYGWKTEVEGAGAAEGETQYAAAALYDGMNLRVFFLNDGVLKKTRRFSVSKTLFGDENRWKAEKRKMHWLVVVTFNLKLCRRRRLSAQEIELPSFCNNTQTKQTSYQVAGICY